MCVWRTQRRERLTLVGASPLSALKLFNRGPALRSIALLQLVSSAGDSSRTACAVHRMQVTQWSTTERGRYSSVSSFISLPGVAAGPRIIAQLGNLCTLQLGIVSGFLSSLLLSQAKAGRDFYRAQLAGAMMMSGPGGGTALSALTMVAGESAGLARGELQARFHTIRNARIQSVGKYQSTHGFETTDYSTRLVRVLPTLQPPS